jgi:hypothetical protein
MATAKVRSLNVRPLQSADLSFEVAGIIAKQHTDKAQLGSRVRGFDLTSLSTVLDTTVANQPETLLYNPDAIQEFINNNYDFLFSLRNDLLATNLRQAITQREIAHLEKYKHITSISNALKKVYASDNQGKLQRLGDLRQLVEQYKEALDSAYQQTQHDRVVTETVTATDNSGAIESKVFLTPVTMKTEQQQTNTPAGAHVTLAHRIIPQAWRGGDWNDINETPDPTFPSQRTETSNNTRQISRTRNLTYNHPAFENKIQEQRTQLNIQDEMFLHETFSFKVSHMEDIMKKELQVLNQEIAKAQHRFIQTFLFSPISGIVTAVYKDVGESVQPGEPVIRVENDDELLIVGLIQHRGLLTVGQTAQISTTNVYESFKPLNITGKIVAVRGHDSDDDEWDVIIRCSNGNKQVPLNYTFDRETTRVEIN